MKKNTNRECDLKKIITLHADSSTAVSCYTEEDWRMASALGINRRRLTGPEEVGRLGGRKGWLSPQFIRYLYQKRFGSLED